jgi:hypothetical protein
MKLKIENSFYLFLFALFLIFQPAFLFAQDVDKIVIRNCLPCHNKENNSGIIFQNLADLKQRSSTIKYLLQNDIMPKTHSVESYSHFKNEIYISKEEKDILLSFLNENNAFNKKLKYKPEKSLKNKKKISYKTNINSFANGDDNYAIIKIPFINKKPLYITGYEIKTSLPKDFHHVGIFVIKKDEKNKFIDKGIDKFYYSSDISKQKEDTLKNLYQLMKIVPKGEDFFWDWMIFKTEWQIGGGAFQFPKNTGFMMPKEGAILLNNVHLRPTPTNKTLSLEITFFYEEEPDDEIDYLYVVDISNTPDANINPPLNIKAKKIQTHTLTTVLPGDMNLHAVSPHMHFLGKSFESFAVSPGLDTTKIILINNWDPDWMKTYQFEKPLKLKEGSIIYCIGTYDNTSKNPRNPNNPPKDVGNAMLFREEMLNMIVTFTTN